MHPYPFNLNKTYAKKNVLAGQNLNEYIPVCEVVFSEY